VIQNLLYPLRDVPVRQSPKRVYAVQADVSLSRGETGFTSPGIF
jgi:hypothetical protein